MIDLYPALRDVDDLGVSTIDRSSSATVSGRGMRHDRASDGDEPLELSALQDPEGGAQFGASVRAEVPGDRGRAGAEALSSWVCYHTDCPNRYPHARLLVAHLIDTHGEGPAR